MRLTKEQIQSIRRIVHDVAGPGARVRLFGSRLQDEAAGGDVDLLIELPDPVEAPAELSALISAQISRAQHGRKIDVVLLAPNLRRLPIHEVALKQGQLL